MKNRNVRLGKLTMRNFRSYLSAEITFPHKGMTLIRGNNLDTQGSSRSGKSTIGLALRYVLDADFPFSVKDQKSWFGTGTTSVSQELITDDGTYTLIKGTQYQIVRPDGTRATGQDAVHLELKKIFGIDMALLALLINKKGTASPNRFLWMPPASKREFLCKVIPGLEQLEALIKKSQERLGSISKEDTLEWEFQVAHFEVRNADSACASLGMIQEPVFADETKIGLELDEAGRRAKVLDTTVEEINKALAQETALRDTVAARPIYSQSAIQPSPLEAVLKQGEERLATLLREDAQRRNETEQECRVLMQKKLEATLALKRKPKLLADIEKKKLELVRLQDSTCPTCKRQWDDVQTEIDAAIVSMRQMTDELATTISHEDRIAELDARLDLASFVPSPKLSILQDTIRHIRREISEEQQKKMKDASDAQEKAATEYRKATEVFDLNIKNMQLKLQEVNKELMKAKMEEQNLCLQLRVTIDENKRRQSDYEACKLKLVEAEKKLHAAIARESDIKELVAAEKDLIELLRSFLTAIFEEILQEIGEKTNTILASVANTASVAIHFSSETTTKTTGELKQQISTTVTIDGFTAEIRSGASDGMLSAIDLAVDRALAMVVAARSNCNPGWVFLDEVWENLDQVSKESCMEMLSKQAQDILVMVVDHGSETKELFQQTIDVEFKNGITSVKEASSEA